MPREYTREELALAEDYVNKGKRIDALEAKIQRDEWDREVAHGRGRAQAAGYGGRRLRELEEFKAENGILDYNHAMAAYEREHPPSLEDNAWFDGGGDEASELFQQYISGAVDDNKYTRKATALALKEVRSGGW
jgi:hypothetical protein